MSILGQERRESWVVPVRFEQEGTNVVRRMRLALESLHAPLPYESCRIHPRKRVPSWPRALGHDWVYSVAVPQEL